MSEGMFDPSKLAVPQIDKDRLVASMVRIMPKTILVIDIANSSEEAAALARNESLPDGSECWYRYFTPDDVKKIDDSVFAMGMVRHEFAKLVRRNADWPARIELDGGGSGFAISPLWINLTDRCGSRAANHRPVSFRRRMPIASDGLRPLSDNRRSGPDRQQPVKRSKTSEKFTSLTFV